MKAMLFALLCLTTPVFADYTYTITPVNPTNGPQPANVFEPWWFTLTLPDPITSSVSFAPMGSNGQRPPEACGFSNCEFAGISLQQGFVEFSFQQVVPGPQGYSYFDLRFPDVDLATPGVYNSFPGTAYSQWNGTEDIGYQKLTITQTDPLPTPEPATGILVCGALLAIGCWKWRKSKPENRSAGFLLGRSR